MGARRRRGSPTRLTFDGDNRRPIWSPDGKRLVYGASTTSANNLVRDQRGRWRQARARLQPATSAADAASHGRPPTWIAFFLERPGGRWFYRNLGSSHRTATASRGSSWNLVSTTDIPGVLTRRALIALWVQRVRGRRSVTHPYPGPGEKIRISTAGRIEPVWTATQAANSSTAPTPVRARGSAPRSAPRPPRSGTTRLACRSRPDPVRIHDAHPRLGGQRRRPAVPSAATC